MKENLSLGLVAVACVALLASSAMGASVFFSDVGTVGGGVVPGDLTLTLPVDGTATLYIWSSDDQNYDRTIGMNVLSDNTDAVSFTAAGTETLNPMMFSNVIQAPTDIRRWSYATVNSVEPGKITKMNAAYVNPGQPVGGVNTAMDGTFGSLQLLDPLWDQDAGAFLIASVGVSTGPIGTALLSINQEDTALFVNQGAAVFPDFLTATINVGAGDMNNDGNVDGLDVDLFVHAVIFEPFNLRGDMNRDGMVTGLDVAPFVDAVTASGVHAVPEPSTLAIATVVLLAVAGTWPRWGNCDVRLPASAKPRSRCRH